MALGADDMQSACRDDLVVTLLPVFTDLLHGRLVRNLQGLDFRIEIPAEHDIRPAACHVGRDGYRSGLPRLGDDVRFPLVLLGV